VVAKAGGRRRAGGFDRRHQNPGCDGKAVMAREPPRDRDLLSGDADVAAAHAAVAQQAGHDEAHGVAGDCEAQALRRKNHRGVDADDLTA